MSRSWREPGVPLLGAGFVIALLLAGSAGAGAAPATSQHALAPGAGSAIDRAETELTRQLDATGIPGGAVVVVHDGGIEARGVGTTGSQGDVGPDTPFMLGSTTKSFTALAVLQLVDAGAVSLEDPVRDYVPELRLAGGEPGNDITVRQVLQHTSGLSDLSAGPIVASAAAGTPLDAVAELRGAHLTARPGREWQYANINYVLAGLVVERASAMSYPDYLQQRILDPLQMSHSHVSVEPARSDGLSQGHRFWFGVPVATGPAQSTAMLAAGYLISTAEDLGRYLTMYLSGGRSPDGTQIVSAAGLRTMLAPGPQAHLGPWAQGRTSRYAMGWFVGGPWSDAALFHPGNSPDSSSMISLFSDRGTAVATLLNVGHELPVPGNPSITDRVSRNVIHAALGQQPTALPSMRRFYLLFDAVVLLLLGLGAWGVKRSVSALVAAESGTAPAHPVKRWAGVGLRILGTLTLLLGVSVVYGWAPLRTWAPDLALAVVALALSWAAAAALRVVGLWRSRPRATPPLPVTNQIGHPHVST